MRSIEKLSHEEEELRLLINSIKNTLTDIPYDFHYDNVDDDDDDYSDENENEGNYAK